MPLGQHQDTELWNNQFPETKILGLPVSRRMRERTAVSNFKSKIHEGSGNELVDYCRAPCLGADQKVRGLWERDWYLQDLIVTLPISVFFSIGGWTDGLP